MENIDLLSDKKRETDRVLIALSIYCRRHRMLEIDLNKLPRDSWDVVGNHVVDFFLELIEDEIGRVPPG